MENTNINCPSVNNCYYSRNLKEGSRNMILCHSLGTEKTIHPYYFVFNKSIANLCFNNPETVFNDIKKQLDNILLSADIDLFFNKDNKWQKAGDTGWESIWLKIREIEYLPNHYMSEDKEIFEKILGTGFNPRRDLR